MSAHVTVMILMSLSCHCHVLENARVEHHISYIYILCREIISNHIKLGNNSEMVHFSGKPKKTQRLIQFNCVQHAEAH